MAEDPTFRIDRDEQTGHMIVHGMDELQLESIVERLKSEFNVAATVGKPQVAYKEMVTQMAEGDDDVRVELYDGSFHEVDSSEMAFKIAGSMAYQKAAKKARPVLLEPVMAVEVVVPEEYMGTVIGDLNARRACVENMELRGTTQIITSSVPFSEMLGYARDLRRRTQGRVTYSMHLDRYEPLPGGPHPDDEDGMAPVVVPRTPRRSGK